MDWADYDSGPFCRHWHDPADCEELCATCGHRCAQHGFGDGSDTACSECECVSWGETELGEDHGTR